MFEKRFDLDTDLCRPYTLKCHITNSVKCEFEVERTQVLRQDVVVQEKHPL